VSSLLQTLVLCIECYLFHYEYYYTISNTLKNDSSNICPRINRMQGRYPCHHFVRITAAVQSDRNDSNCGLSSAGKVYSFDL